MKIENSHSIEFQRDVKKLKAIQATLQLLPVPGCGAKKEKLETSKNFKDYSVPDIFQLIDIFIRHVESLLLVFIRFRTKRRKH